jgi:hypothetical protein
MESTFLDSKISIREHLHLPQPSLCPLYVMVVPLWNEIFLEVRSLGAILLGTRREVKALPTTIAASIIMDRITQLQDAIDQVEDAHQ